MSKSIRLRIAGGYPGVLKYGGLKSAEYKGLKTWNGLSEEEKAQRKAKFVKMCSDPQRSKSKEVLE